MTISMDEAAGWDATKRQQDKAEGTLRLGEYHPGANIAKQYLQSRWLKLIQYEEALASCAIEGNRIAQVSCETLRRLRNKEPISDRYLMGLAWTIWELENANTETD